MRRVLVIRYGGFGDALQAASILPGLKDQGWHITWDASEQGFELLRNDPLIDALMLTPRGSVADAELGVYWNARTNGFNRIINLCESVENSSLMKPNVLGFFHDDEIRRRLYGDTNYVEHIHRIAGTSGPYVPRYVPTIEELARAGRGVMGSAVVCLSGSAEYKIWPHVPAFVAQLLPEIGGTVYLAGGARDAVLARDVLEFVGNARPESVDRVIDMTAWPIRQAIATAWTAEVVVGPETGVLNAVAGTKGRKVVLLSHSSPTNLTKHWINTIPVRPEVACHPCHRLHQTTKFCPRGPSGNYAACAESILPSRILAACLTSNGG